MISEELKMWAKNKSKRKKNMIVFNDKQSE